NRVTAVGLGVPHEFQATLPQVAYRQIEAGERLPPGDRDFDIATSNAVLEHVGSVATQRLFVAELVRVAATVLISVPHRFFPAEHHTAIPFAHWTNLTFRIVCRIFAQRRMVESREPHSGDSAPSAAASPRASPSSIRPASGLGRGAPTCSC